MILVDTSVIADILTKDPEWFAWSSEQIEYWADVGAVCFDTIVFAELAVKFDTQKELEHRLSAFTYLSLPLNAAFQAGKAFEKYRRAGGKKTRPLPDSFIGAHAYVAHLPLLTRDPPGANLLSFRAARHAVKPRITPSLSCSSQRHPFLATPSPIRHLPSPPLTAPP
jgi:predicted nucleic acid-binding protein